MHIKQHFESMVVGDINGKFYLNHNEKLFVIYIKQ